MSESNTWQQKIESTGDLYTRLSEQTGISRSIVKNRVFMLMYSPEAIGLTKEQLYQKCLDVLGYKS